MENTQLVDQEDQIRRIRQSSTSSSISSHSSQVVKSKNSRPTGGKPTGRGTAASVMNGMVEIMRESLAHQQVDLHKQETDLLKIMLERQEKNEDEERRILQDQLRLLQTQVATLMQQQNSRSGGVRNAGNSSSSSSHVADPEATQFLPDL